MTTSNPNITSPPRHEIPLPHEYPPYATTNDPPITTISTTNTNSRFHFHSDTKAPSQLSTLERQTYNRHTEFIARLNAIDRKIASWTTRHATEVLDRDLDLVGLYNWLVCDPLERCGGRVLDKLERDLGSLWEDRPEERGRDTESTMNDSVIDGDDGGTRGGLDEEKETEWKDVSHTNGTNGSCDGGGAKGNDDDNILACITTTAQQQSNDEEFSTSTLLNDEFHNPLPISSPAPQFPMITYEEGEEMNPSHNPAQPSVLPPKSAATTTSSTTTIQSLSKRINNLSTNLNTFVHKTIPDQCRESLESLHQNQLQADLPPKIHIEQTKSTKREGFMVRRFESISGMGYRSVVEENAARLASLTLLEEQIASAGRLDEERTGRYLAEVKEIRRMIQQERNERVMQDEVVINRLVETRQMLQRSLECLD